MFTGLRNLTRLRRDQGGMSVVFFAAAVVPTFTAIGGGVDVSKLTIVRNSLTAAVDAAALAGGRVYYDDDRQTDIERYFNANMSQGLFNSTIDGPYSADDGAGGNLRVWATATMPTSFLRIVGINEIKISAESTTSRESAMMDVVLAIDLSGSMRSSVPGESASRIEAAKTAAQDLVNILYGDPPSTQVRIAVVPWGGKVNVSDFGTEHGKDSFGNDLPDPVGNGTMNDRYRAVSLGQTYDNPYLEEKYTYSYDLDGNNVPGIGVDDDPFVDGRTDAKKRFILTDGYSDRISKVYYAHNSAVPLLSPPPEDWKGCVYARYAFTGRPSAWNQVSAGSTDKSADRDNAADRIDGVATSVGPNNLDWVGWMPMGAEGDPQSGDNKCDMARLLNIGHECTPCLDSGIHRLSYSKADAISVIQGLEAESSVYTNIPQGLMWAYRALSDAEPFTEGANVSPALQGFARERAIVLLTDGANTFRAGDAYNRGIRGTSRRDQRLKDVANMIKDNDTYVYTVQFANGSSDLATLMKDVATKPDAPFYNYAPTSEDLRNSFRAVANNLANLRISK